jgi:hypothetical protein
MISISHDGRGEVISQLQLNLSQDRAVSVWRSTKGLSVRYHNFLLLSNRVIIGE